MPHSTELERLLRPRSVAVIGASNDPQKIGGRPIDYLQRYGFPGRIYPINRDHAQVQGLKAYERLDDVPGEVDLAIIALPAAATNSALADCGRLHIPYAVVFTSGFAESGLQGAQSQHELLEIARSGGVRLLGPNSLGIISEPSRLTATFSTVLDRPSGLIAGETAFISQSGAFGSLFYAIAKETKVSVFVISSPSGTRLIWAWPILFPPLSWIHILALSAVIWRDCGMWRAFAMRQSRRSRIESPWRS